MDINTRLRTLLLASISLLLISCSSDEEKPKTSLLSNQYNLEIDFTQAEQDLGVVNVQPSNLECKGTCTSNVAADTVVKLTATPKVGAVFVGWSGDCTGNTTCQVTMSAAHTITANFVKEATGSNNGTILSVSIEPGGSVMLSDNLGECKEDCKLGFVKQQLVTLSAIAETGYSFSGWSGDCTGDSDCKVTMSTSHAVTATFTEAATETTLSLTVATGGSVAFSNDFADCATDCQLGFTQQEVITLTAMPKVGYVFVGWNGDCAAGVGVGANFTAYSDTDIDCLVNMSANQAVNASFKFSSHTCTNQATLPAGHFDAEYPYNKPTNNPNNNGSNLETLLTDFTVKESSGKGVSNYPVSMVFPVEYGLFFHPGDFHIKNNAGEIIPAQFNVINRWWAKDRSLRHIQAHFNVDIDAYIKGLAATGSKTFQLYSGSGNIRPTYSVCATESDTEIHLNNGLIDIKITKNPLTITTPAGQLKSLFTKENSESDYSFEHSNIKIELEEIGYLRTIVKISSLTNYVSPTDIKHGWALRLYMYANTDKVKVDFQLQNAALNTTYSAPLYFQNHQLVLSASGSTAEQVVQANTIDGEMISSGVSGVISTPKVNVFFRDFWQRFPQGLSTTADGSLLIELWPAWSKQFLSKEFALSDFYWLDDMRQTYKEVLLDFSQQTQADYLDNISRNFQYSPVALLPQEYYQKTQVTFELGGYFPISTIPDEKARIPRYWPKDFSEPTSAGRYKFGQDNYGLDLPRKKATNQAGGTPYSKRRFFVSGDPTDYYSSQDFAKAEINIRPQWLAGYNHDKNFSTLRLTANPYGGNTWRRFKGHGLATLTRAHIDGSVIVAHPRDDQHAWFYHVEHAYLMSGNKWLKDWYQFMAEFKQGYLQGMDPWPDRSNRAEGHNLSVALSAYRVTDNTTLGSLLSNYTNTMHRKYLLAPHNISVGSLTKDNPSAAVYQQGYLVKPFIELTYEFPDQGVTLEFIKNYVSWNYNYANFSYYRSVLDYQISTKASGTSLSFVDVAIWYSMHTEDAKYADHAINFVQSGIGGVKPFGTFSYWRGQYEGLLYNYYFQQGYN